MERRKNLFTLFFSEPIFSIFHPIELTPRLKALETNKINSKKKLKLH